MILTIVTFPAPTKPTGNPRELLKATAPAYRLVPGLRRKYFVGDGAVAGGVYEWVDRASAEQYFNAEWLQRMQDRYSVNPSVQYFDAPCLVDNVVGGVLFDLEDS